MRKNILSIICTSLLICYLKCTMVFASLIAECGNMEYVKANALEIVHGKIVTAQLKKDAYGEIYTFYTIKVDTYVKGTGPEIVTIKEPGGSFQENGKQMIATTEDAPTFNIGDSGYLYLKQTDTDEFYSTICGSGFYENN